MTDYYFTFEKKTVRFIPVDIQNGDTFPKEISKDVILSFNEIILLLQEMKYPKTFLLFSRDPLSLDSHRNKDIFSRILFTIIEKLSYEGKTQEEIETKYLHLINSLNTLLHSFSDKYIDLSDSFMQIDDKYAMKYEGGKPKEYFGLTNSFDALVFLLPCKIKSTTLSVYCCEYCGKLYFQTSKRNCCPCSECQHIRHLEYNRKMREKQKKDTYRNLINSYNTYVRQLKRELTLIRVDDSDMQRFTDEQKKCAAIISETAIEYKNSKKPIDQKLNNLVQENRTEMREITNSIRKKYFRKADSK